MYAVFVATLVGWTAFMAGRWGSPRRWPLAHRVGLVFVSLSGSLAWWWVNGAVEGRTITTLSHNHGVTKGDLLAVPALLLAGALVALEAAPRLRRLIETSQPTSPTSSRPAPRSTSVK